MKHRYAPKAENKNATELQGYKLRVAPKILATAYCRADFYQKRNPQLLLYIDFSVYVCAPYGWLLFFLFFIILLYYIIYKYIYIYNNIYIYIQYIDIPVHEQIQSKKQKPMKVAGCVLSQNPVCSML